jgi:electron transport complex protein RnfG
MKTTIPWGRFIWWSLPRKTTGIKILSQAETPGLGANAEDSFFTDRFKGKSIEEPLEVVKQEPAGDNQILAITSATITSKAVANGVNIARAHFTENFVQ